MATIPRRMFANIIRYIDKKDPEYLKRLQEEHQYVELHQIAEKHQGSPDLNKGEIAQVCKLLAAITAAAQEQERVLVIEAEFIRGIALLFYNYLYNERDKLDPTTNEVIGGIVQDVVENLSVEKERILAIIEGNSTETSVVSSAPVSEVTAAPPVSTSATSELPEFKTFTASNIEIHEAKNEDNPSTLTFEDGDYAMSLEGKVLIIDFDGTIQAGNANNTIIFIAKLIELYYSKRPGDFGRDFDSFSLLIFRKCFDSLFGKAKISDELKDDTLKSAIRALKYMADTRKGKKSKDKDDAISKMDFDLTFTSICTRHLAINGGDKGVWKTTIKEQLKKGYLITRSPAKFIPNIRKSFVDKLGMTQAEADAVKIVSVAQSQLKYGKQSGQILVNILEYVSTSKGLCPRQYLVVDDDRNNIKLALDRSFSTEPLVEVASGKVLLQQGIIDDVCNIIMSPGNDSYKEAAIKAMVKFYELENDEKIKKLSPEEFKDEVRIFIKNIIKVAKNQDIRCVRVTKFVHNASLEPQSVDPFAALEKTPSLARIKAVSLVQDQQPSVAVAPVRKKSFSLRSLFSLSKMDSVPSENIAVMLRITPMDVPGSDVGAKIKRGVNGIIETFNIRIAKRFDGRDQEGMKNSKFLALQEYSINMKKILEHFKNVKSEDGLKLFEQAVIAETMQLWVEIKKSQSKGIWGSFKDGNFIKDLNLALQFWFDINSPKVVNFDANGAVKGGDKSSTDGQKISARMMTTNDEVLPIKLQQAIAVRIDGKELILGELFEGDRKETPAGNQHIRMSHSE